MPELRTLRQLKVLKCQVDIVCDPKIYLTVAYEHGSLIKERVCKRLHFALIKARSYRLHK